MYCILESSNNIKLKAKKQNIHLALNARNAPKDSFDLEIQKEYKKNKIFALHKVTKILIFK